MGEACPICGEEAEFRLRPAVAYSFSVGRYYRHHPKPGPYVYFHEIPIRGRENGNGEEP